MSGGNMFWFYTIEVKYTAVFARAFVAVTGRTSRNMFAEPVRRREENPAAVVPRGAEMQPRCGDRSASIYSLHELTAG